MSTIPDPEEDFDGCIEGLIGDFAKQYLAIPEGDRTEWLIGQSAGRLYRLKKANAPAFIIEHEKRLLQKCVAELPVYCADYVDPTIDDSSDPTGAPNDG